MTRFSENFGPFGDHIWLNTASEGALPKTAVTALQEAIQWKIQPHLLTHVKFASVPQELKKSLAALIHVDPKDIILGNSATYGIHILANGFPFEAGDEILLMQNDFPTDILPWLGLEKENGAVARQLKSVGPVLTPEELRSAITPKTRLVCLPHVHTFSGHAIDVQTIGRICREKKITFVLNCAQSFGTSDIDITKLPVDAVTSAGYKWLMGPYSTGFCWMRPELRERLSYNQAYWTALLDAKALAGTDAITLPEDTSSRRYDIFCTANFFNYVPWKASIDYLLNLGLEQVRLHNSELIAELIESLSPDYFRILSPVDPKDRTNLFVFSHLDATRNAHIFESLNAAGVHVAFWKGNLRVSPHLYNTTRDIQRFLDIVHSLK